jgi:hypothetical protein
MDKPQVHFYYTQDGQWMLVNSSQFKPFRDGTVPAGHIHEFVVTMLTTLTPITWVCLRPMTAEEFKDRLN